MPRRSRLVLEEHLPVPVDEGFDADADTIEEVWTTEDAWEDADVAEGCAEVSAEVETCVEEAVWEAAEEVEAWVEDVLAGSESPEPLSEPLKATAGPGMEKLLKLSDQMSGNSAMVYRPGMETREEPDGTWVPLPVTFT